MLVAGCHAARPVRPEAVPPAVVPLPSQLVGARWWNGTDFDEAPRFVAEGRFRAPGGPLSETVTLPPLFAVPLSEGDCDRRPVSPRVPLPEGRALVPGQAADFYLTPTDPRQGSARAVALVCAGRLVE